MATHLYNWWALSCHKCRVDKMSPSMASTASTLSTLAGVHVTKTKPIQLINDKCHIMKSGLTGYYRCISCEQLIPSSTKIHTYTLIEDTHIHTHIHTHINTYTHTRTNQLPRRTISTNQASASLWCCCMLGLIKYNTWWLNAVKLTCKRIIGFTCMAHIVVCSFHNFNIENKESILVGNFHFTYVTEN